MLPAGEFPIAIPPLNQNDITSGDFDITEDLTITGAGQTATTIDGGVPKAGSGAEIPGLDRLFAVAPGVDSVSLSDLRLQDGYAQEFGGAVFNEGDATVQLTNVTVANNLASKNGGGVDDHANGTVDVSGSTFTANSSIEGGSGLNNNRAGTLTVTSSTLTNNHGGSAILNNGEFDVYGTISVTDSTISDNTATAGPATTGSGLGTLEWTVTEQVQAMYTGANHGFMIRDSQEGDTAGPEQQLNGRSKAPTSHPSSSSPSAEPATPGHLSRSSLTGARGGSGHLSRKTGTLTRTSRSRSSGFRGAVPRGSPSVATQASRCAPWVRGARSRASTNVREGQRRPCSRWWT